MLMIRPFDVLTSALVPLYGENILQMDKDQYQKIFKNLKTNQ